MENIIEKDEIPNFKEVKFDNIRNALTKAVEDYKNNFILGISIAAIYMLIGASIEYITIITNNTFWLVLAISGFPIIGPFAAIFYYKISQNRDKKLRPKDIIAEVYKEKDRQIPSISAFLVFIMLLWFFIGHMIFALFMSKIPFTNIMSSYEVYFTTQGLLMLSFGSLVGLGFSILVFSITFIGLPILMEKEIDYITAMIISYKYSVENFKILIIWGTLISTLVILSIMTFFVGLIVVLPILGHASWHIYDEIREI